MIKGQPKVRGEATRRRHLLKFIFWPVAIALLAGVPYLIWRDLSEGRFLKILIIGAAVSFMTWRYYSQAARSAKH
jgi:hypothetical protein